MPGRGDNNKHGAAGRGSSNQGNEPFVTAAEKEPKPTLPKHRTGGLPSEKQEKKKIRIQEVIRSLQKSEQARYAPTKER